MNQSYPFEPQTGSMALQNVSLVILQRLSTCPYPSRILLLPFLNPYTYTNRAKVGLLTGVVAAGSPVPAPSSSRA